jgi:endonuclease YncB( thermonuclease family)
VSILRPMLLTLSAVFAAGQTFTCTPIRVWDGDGPIWCAEGPKIRLAAIATRELKLLNGRVVDAGCNVGHPCPHIDGLVARDALVRFIGRRIGQSSSGHVLIQGPPLRCVSEGSGKGSRTAAWCSGSTGDLSCTMVRGGYALRWSQHDRRRKLCR